MRAGQRSGWIEQYNAVVRAILSVVLIGLAMPNDEASASEEVWFTATGEEAGLPMVYRSRLRPPPGIETHEFPYEIRVYWPYEPANSRGMPDAETNADHIDFEDALLPLDDVEHSFLMIVATGNGRKEWLWYARDFDAWIGRLNDLLKSHSVYPLDIVYELDPDWMLHRNFIDTLEGPVPQQ